MSQYKHLTDYVRANASHHADKLALVSGDKALTWKELADEVEQTSERLNTVIGSTKSEIVSLLMPSGWQAVVAYLAILESGHIASPIDVIFKPIEIEAILRQIPSKLVIADSANADRIKTNVPAMTFDELAEQKKSKSKVDRLDPDNQIATLLFTSGTTGEPKAAAYSHANQAWNVDVCSRVWEWDSNDSLLISLRLSHMYGIVMGLTGAIYHGNTLYLQERFDAKQTLEMLSSGKISIFTHFANVYSKLLEEPGDYDLSKVRLCISGGAPLPPVVWQKFKDRFNQEILECYGTTETGRIASNLLDERIPGSPGRPLPEVKLKFGKSGEVMVKSPGVVTGYWKNEELTKKARDEEGYWHTGDIGEMVEGRLVLKGRLQEKIRRQGYTVSPRDVEWALLSNSAIKEAYVSGVQSPGQADDQLIYYLVTNLSESQIADFYKQALPSVWRPDKVIKLDKIPKTRSGKANIQALRSML